MCRECTLAFINGIHYPFPSLVPLRSLTAFHFKHSNKIRHAREGEQPATSSQHQTQVAYVRILARVYIKDCARFSMVAEWLLEP